MTKAVVKIPFFGFLYLLSGHLRIDRGDREKAVAALSDVAKLVRKHRLGIWIMPEGTRSRDGRLRVFKPGFVHLAIATGLPVVPVVLHGVHRVWEHGTYAFVPKDVHVDVLEPVDTSSWKADSAQLHAEQVRALFAAALVEEQQPLPAPELVPVPA
jgi:1-acyl-sn-glycerol-3-phosphate acyltransferase